MNKDLIGEPPPQSVEPPSDNPHYQAWREGYAAGYNRGWGDCKRKVIQVFERLAGNGRS